MKILIVDGPGVHPRTAARALGRGLHGKGHGVIVHPIQLEKLGRIKAKVIGALIQDELQRGQASQVVCRRVGQRLHVARSRELSLPHLSHFQG